MRHLGDDLALAQKPLSPATKRTSRSWTARMRSRADAPFGRDNIRLMHHLGHERSSATSSRRRAAKRTDHLRPISNLEEYGTY
jgi:hypothetical protein